MKSNLSANFNNLTSEYGHFKLERLKCDYN